MRSIMSSRKRHRVPPCRFSIMVVLLALLVVVQTARACDDYDFVQEVVAEDQEHYNDHYSSTMDGANDLYDQDMLRQQDEDERLRQQQEHAEEQERRAEQARNEIIQKEREEAFEAELARMSEEKRKAAIKQKKRDAAVARRVLKAASSENHYAVLGLRNNRELRIPGRSITIIPGYFSLTIPEVKLFHVDNRQIKKAYREKAKTVHPDKSKDGRAVEAFLAVENAASILLDETARAEYDQKVLQHRQARRAKMTGIAQSGLQRGYRVTSQVIGTAKRILGPFAFPVLILAVLIF
jgi:DnaJ domain